MSNKFLNIGGETNLTNGTAIIYARSLGADNLQPSSALKTNSVNEIVSSDLEISDINNLQNTLDNVLTNPYVGTLNVSDLTTDTITNLNTSITNLENKTSNIEIGGTNLTNTFTTTQTTFTQDQELITKKYLDDNSSNLPTDIINVNEVKAYGFSDSLTLSSNIGSQSNIEITTQKFGKINLNSDTDLQNDLVVGEEDILTQNHKFLKTDKTPSTLPQDTMNGVVINGLSTLLIKRVYIPTNCWTGTDTTKTIGIWNNDGYLINSYTIDKTDLQFSRYYKDINEELVKGTIYRIGVLMKSGEGQMLFSEVDLDSYILDSNPSGNVYGCFENSSSFIFPSGYNNATSLNVEFVVQNSLTKNVGFNHFKGGLTIVDNLLGGKKPLQTIIKDDFRGSEIKGNPTETGNITLINNASIGGVVQMGNFTNGSTGSLTYSNIYDMVNTNNIMNVRLNCKLDWFSEGFFNVIYDEEGSLTPVYLLKFISPVGNTFPKTFHLEIYNGISLVKTLNFMLDLDNRGVFIDFEIKHNFDTNLFELYINNFLVGNHTFTSPLTQTLTNLSIGGGANNPTSYNPFYLKNVNIFKKDSNETPFQFSASQSGVIIENLTLTKPITQFTSPNQSTILSTIDYSNMYPSLMRANITNTGGGVNKCWGHTAKYLAGVNLLAGRLVSLKDQDAGTDNTKFLEVEYVKTGSETTPTTSPIGITQNNANVGEVVEVCILGYTTGIAYNSDTSPERGSQIFTATTGSNGEIYINTTGGGNEGRVGFMAQSDSISAGDAFLLYVDSWYQPY